MSKIDLAGTGGGSGNVNAGGTLTNHQLVVGRGSTNVAVIPPLNDGQLAIGSTGIDPVPATLTAGANVTITNAPGSITIASTGGGGTAPLPQFNPIVKGTHGTLSSGNSILTNDGTGGTYATSLSVGGHDGGKWYAEFKDVVAPGNGNYFGIGDSATALNTYGGQDSHSWVIFDNFTFVYHNSATGVSVGTPTTGSVVQIAWDADTGNVWWGINNVWQNAGDPVAETNPCATGVFGYLYLVGGVAFTTGKIAYQSLVYAPPQGYSEWGLAGSATKAGLPANSVQYNNSGSVSGAANFNILTGDPNVTAGNQYLYDGIQAYASQTLLTNYYLGPTGNFTTTGNNNSAFGANCLINLTTGSYNSAEGTQALLNCTTGSANVGLGFNALRACTTGSNNFAMGRDALTSTMTAAGCTAIGTGALQFFLTGDTQLAVGGAALQLQVSGVHNTAIGTQCLASSSDGSENIGIGAQAGVGLVHGGRNTFIGNATAASIVSGNYNIVIGWECDVPIDTDGQLSIGNYIYGTGLTGTGSTISTGKIGIGIKAPAVELDVNGSINVPSGKAYQYNSVIALQADTAKPNWFFGNSGNLSMTGINNLSVGNLALRSNTTGAANIGIGSLALNALASGDNNVAVGVGALQGATSATACLALGALSMGGATGGTNNVGIGAATLYSNTTGGNNSALGAGALQNNTTGDGNSADGFTALGSNTTGNNNFAMGRTALGASIDGSDNVGIGHNALFSLLHGSNNTVIGSTALQSGTTNNFCVSIGFSAGYNVTGDNNTFIGAGAGADSTSTSNSIAIGCSNYLPSNTAAGQLVIGNYIYGTGLTGTTTTISTGKIGIGIKAPTASLHIQNSTTGQANLRLDPTSAAGPSSPNDGDMWYDGTHLDFRHAGVTSDLLAVGGAPSTPLNSVQYDNAGAFGGAANMSILSGNPVIELATSVLSSAYQIKKVFGGNQNAMFAIDNTGGFGDPDWFLGGAGNFTLTAGGTGGNFCEGPNAGAALTTGFWNMVEGTGALASMTDGHGNLAFGRFAAHALVHGQDNVAIGSGSLSVATGGSFNMAVGVGAMGSGVLVLGSNGNVAIGNVAGKSLATASDCILLGDAVAQNMTSAGAPQIVIGANAGGGLSIPGAANVIIGDSAGGALSTGFWNVVIGSQAGNNLSGGITGNVLLGQFAGLNHFATGSQCIIIGFNCDVPSASANGQISIGNMIYGTNCTGSGVTPSTGQIGIGLVAPAVELDVFGRIKTLVYSAATTALPAAGNKGARAFVADATVNTFASAYASGGANNVPVYDDGAAWRIG